MLQPKARVPSNLLLRRCSMFDRYLPRQSSMPVLHYAARLLAAAVLAWS